MAEPVATTSNHPSAPPVEMLIVAESAATPVNDRYSPSASQDEKNGNVTCQVCMEFFSADCQKPCVLPVCGHTICFSCSMSLCKDNAIMCPFCSKISVVTGCDNLVVNKEILEAALSAKRKMGIELQSLDLEKSKEFALKKLTKHCKGLTSLQNKLFRKSMDGLRQSMVLYAQYAEVSGSLRRGLENIERLQDTGHVRQQNVELELAHLNSLMDSLDSMENDSEPENRTSCPCIDLIVGDMHKCRLNFESEKLHLYCSEELQEKGDVEIRMPEIERLYMSRDTATVFLDLATEDMALGRIYIDLFGCRDSTRQFVSMCLASYGLSYKGANFQLGGLTDVKFVTTGNCIDEKGSSLMEPLGECIPSTMIPSHPVVEGSIVPRFMVDGVVSTKFAIFLQDIDNVMPTLGKVKTGMEVLQLVKDVLLTGVSVVIHKCGVIVERSEE